MNEPLKRICILGGGFGGLYAALRLDSLPWEDIQKPEIVLIDKNDRFLFLPLLYELVTEELQTWEIAPPFEELLADTSVKFHQATVTGVNTESKQVYLDDSSQLDYDRLVLAIGGKTPLDIVPGAAEFAIPFRSIDDAYSLKEKLRELENSNREKIRIAVVGGGYSGVELICKLADRLGEKGRLRLIDRGDRILKNSAEFNREAAKKTLKEKEVWLDLETTVTEVKGDSISLEYKGKIDTIPVDIVLWTVGNKAAGLVETLNLDRSKKGLINTKKTLQTASDPNIFAIGDLADCQDATGQQLDATAQVAFQQSDYCAWNVWASLTGRPMLEFRYQPLGEMMTLGTNSATLNGLGLKLDGNLAHLARRLIYLYRLPTLKHQLAVGFNWISQPAIDLLTK
ncbi:MAG: NAD(P)/FAD-dependent oxidoreductase [Prochloraceae cyanobacterium]|nr:NAD(P)/FAD-dependent oxidoreductase [Prochloraceae cyanobacterium]